jgi:chlorobactene glucosyltransferase
MIFVITVIGVILGVMVLNALFNVIIFPRLFSGGLSLQEELPLVSILIPARNEAAVIEQTIRQILQQTYPHFELLVLDDQSQDGTGDLARQAGANDPRLRVLSGLPMTTGWTGKNHACHVLSQHAQGEILIFTDADTLWQPDALTALMARMQCHNADLLSVWPTQITETWAERLVVPLIMLAIVGYLPLVMVHYSPFALFAAANGQCMAWRRAAYERVGGHAAVASSVLEDVLLARRAKQQGMRLWLCDGAGLIACRMYNDWSGVRDGFAKNILAGYGSAGALIIATIFHWVIFLGPWLLLLTPYTAWGLLLMSMSVLLRALTAASSGQRIRDALLLPLSVLLMTVIAFQALRWHMTGGPRWKGRIIGSRHG